MKNVGALLFSESVDVYNRYALVTCNPATDLQWSIAVNGTDNNGQRVFPLFITIDNYSNPNAVSYSIDGVNGGVAAYTKSVIAINPFTRNVLVTLNNGVVNIYFSEKKLPISEGQKFQVSSSSFSIIYTTGGTFTVPNNWNNSSNKIHAIGAGVNGVNSAGAGLAGRGGGGGAYARLENVILTIGEVLSITIPAANSGADTTLKRGATTLLSADAANPANSNGGLASNCIGDIKYDGGDGGDATVVNRVGGGGAAGPNGAGLDFNLQNGGAGDSGVTGGLGGIAGLVANDGGNGVTWTRIQDGGIFGPGGGGAGGTGGVPNAGDGGNYGAGGGGGFDAGLGGVGKAALLVIEWTP